MDVSEATTACPSLSELTLAAVHRPIYSWYEWLPYKGKGLMVANRPWDGTYNVTDTIWATAHTTQVK